jgi:hypothetical protein
VRAGDRLYLMFDSEVLHGLGGQKKSGGLPLRMRILDAYSINFHMATMHIVQIRLQSVDI